MERYFVHRLVASLIVISSTAAQADILPTFLPGNGNGGGAVQPQPPFEGGARISDVTRKAGGAVYKLDLAKALPLIQVKAKAKLGRVKVISVTLVTDKNEKIALKNLTNVAMAESDAAIPSESLSNEAGIAGIEVQAEAIGGNASLDISAVSNKAVPQLALHEDNGNSCSKKFDAILKEKLDVVQLWAGRAESSAAGSWQEKYASKEFTKYVGEFIATMKAGAPSVASTEYTLTLLNFFTERVNASRADSAAEAGYKSLAIETFDVFLASFQTEQTCRVVSSDGLINIAVDFQKKQDASKADSRGRKIYEMMITKLGKFIPSVYHKELAGKNLTFRQADTEGAKFYKMFNTSKADNFLKPTYQEMSTNAYAIAEQALIREVKALDNEQTYQLIVEFQAKYNDAASYPQDIMMKFLTILSEHSAFLMIQGAQ